MARNYADLQRQAAQNRASLGIGDAEWQAGLSAMDANRPAMNIPITGLPGGGGFAGASSLGGGGGSFGYQSMPNGGMGGGPALPSLPSIGSLQGGGGGGGFSLPRSWGDVGSMLGGAGRWLLNNPEVPLAVVGGVLGHQQQKKADEMNERAIALMEQDYAASAPIRAAGLAGLQNQERPDTSFAIDRFNPYASQGSSLPPAAGGAGGVPVGAVGGGGRSRYSPPPQPHPPLPTPPRRFPIAGGV